jgi:hypothetical protein
MRGWRTHRFRTRNNSFCCQMITGRIDFILETVVPDPLRTQKGITLSASCNGRIAWLRGSAHRARQEDHSFCSDGLCAHSSNE